MIIERLRPEFVVQLPAEPEPGLLYVSIDFATTVHSCCCGCGGDVILPLRPGAWKLTYDGVNVSMSPSVGNWSFACRSHYVISDGRVDWRADWTSAQVENGRKRASVERGVTDAPDRPARTGLPGRWRKFWSKVVGR